MFPSPNRFYPCTRSILFNQKRIVIVFNSRWKLREREQQMKRSINNYLTALTQEETKSQALAISFTMIFCSRLKTKMSITCEAFFFLSSVLKVKETTTSKSIDRRRKEKNNLPVIEMRWSWICRCVDCFFSVKNTKSIVIHHQKGWKRVHRGCCQCPKYFASLHSTRERGRLC